MFSPHVKLLLPVEDYHQYITNDVSGVMEGDTVCFYHFEFMFILDNKT